MQLTEIFAKDVQRPIEGVIKADDVAHLGTEVDEYVLTNEAAKGLELLLEAYTNYTNANGVWISGFFGSGKSHLLKMLAHLLGDVDRSDKNHCMLTCSYVFKRSDVSSPMEHPSSHSPAVHISVRRASGKTRPAVPAQPLCPMASRSAVRSTSTIPTTRSAAPKRGTLNSTSTDGQSDALV